MHFHAHSQRTFCLGKWSVFRLKRTFLVSAEPLYINKLIEFTNVFMSKIRLQENLRFLLKEQSRPLSRVASLSQMNKSTLHGYLNGVIPRSLLSLVELAKTLGVDPRELLFGDLSQEERRGGDKTLLIGERFEITIKPLPPGEKK